MKFPKSSSTFNTDAEPLGFPMSPKETKDYQAAVHVFTESEFQAAIERERKAVK